MGKEGECLGYAADCETICLAFSETSEVFLIFFLALGALRTTALRSEGAREASLFCLFVFFFITSYAKNDSFLSFYFRIYFCLATRSEHNAQLRCAPNASVFWEKGK